MKKLTVLSKFSAIFTSIGIGFTATVAIYPLIPIFFSQIGLQLPIAILIGFSGSFCQVLIYWNDSETGARHLLRNPLLNVRFSLYARTLMQDPTFKKKLTHAYLAEHQNLHSNIHISLDTFSSNMQTDGDTDEALPTSAHSVPNKVLYLYLKQRIRQGYKSNQYGNDAFGTLLRQKITQCNNDRILDKRISDKQFLEILALITALVNGLAFYGLINSHLNSALVSIALQLCGGTLPGSVAVGIPIFVFFAALPSIYSYTLLMYRFMSQAIENNIFNTFKKSLTKLFTYQYDPKSHLSHEMQYAIHLLKCALVLLAFIAVIVISCIVVISYAGAWIDGTDSTFTMYLHLIAHASAHVDSITTSIANALILIFVVPSTILFTAHYSWKSVRKMGSLLKQFFWLTVFCILHPKEALQALTAHIHQAIEKDPYLPLRIPGYILGFVVSVVLLALHSISEGALAYEGVANKPDYFSRIFIHCSNTIDRILGLPARPEIIALVSNAGSEFTSDLPFIVGEQHNNKVVTAEHSHGGDIIIDRAGWLSKSLIKPVIGWVAPAYKAKLDQHDNNRSNIHNDSNLTSSTVRVSDS